MGSSLGLVFGLGFTDPQAPAGMQIFEFHQFLLLMLIFISIFVGGILLSFWTSGFSLGSTKGASLDFLESKGLEVVWTLFPLMILAVIGVFSLQLLYESDLGSNYPKQMNKMKVIGRQWYWSYNYSVRKLWPKVNKNLLYDSYMMNTPDLSLGGLRNLEVDKPLIMKNWGAYSLRTTSSDVIHSFSVPSFGVKLDSVPGRLKELKFLCLQPGMYFGQCSELCGVNHSFMPMKMECLELGFFLSRYNFN